VNTPRHRPLASPWPQTRGGFTLIEILVATAILAILAVMAYGILGTILRQEKQTRGVDARLSHVSLTLVELSRLLSEASPRPIRNAQGALRPAFRATVGARPRLVFTAATGQALFYHDRSGLSRLGLGVRDHRLILYRWPVLDRAGPMKPRATTLLRHVRDFHVRMLDVFGHWHHNWPPLASNPALFLTRRPRAVLLSFRARGMGRLRLLVDLP
jgi:general secretion pathway protein J